MEEHKKMYTDKSEFLKAGIAIGKYQKIHNIIRKDYMELLRVTEMHKEIETEFNALYRACLKSLFSLIEADIFGLNSFDKYEKYSDRHSFETKFKMTFSQICGTWNRTELKNEYFDTKYFGLKNLRYRRDELIHPKKVEHIHIASESEFNKLKQVFNEYDDFINKVMENFFIGYDGFW